MDPDINDTWTYSWGPIFQAKKAYNQMMGSVCITPLLHGYGLLTTTSLPDLSEPAVMYLHCRF
jgi:hypothetical protein